jgi:hypothetical protein
VSARALPRLALLAAAAAAAGGCAGGERTGSPTCGMAQLIGPSLILEQLKRLPYVLTDAPRGLPGSLPARVADTAFQSSVSVRYDRSQLTMAYAGANFPSHPTDSSVFALLVVDDSTQRVQGVLLYQGRRPPPSYPELGTVAGRDATIPLYGVRVNWRGVNNPACPLLGTAVGPNAPPGPARAPVPRP